MAPLWADDPVPSPPLSPTSSLSAAQPQADGNRRQKKITARELSPRKNATALPSPVGREQADKSPMRPKINKSSGAIAATPPSTPTACVHGNVAASHLQPPAALLQAAPTPSLAPSSLTKVALPQLIVDLLDRANGGPLVPCEVSRCLACQPGYNPGNWEFILRQAGLNETNIRLLVNVMYGMVRDDDF
jgi:hypothetical protein